MMNKIRYLLESVNLLFEYRDELSALNTLLALWRRAKSPSEKESAESLYKKTLSKIAAEYGQQTADAMDKYVSSGKADEDDSRLKPAKRDAAGNITVPAQTLQWPPATQYSGYRSSATGASTSSSKGSGKSSAPNEIWRYKTFAEFWTSPEKETIKKQLSVAQNWYSWTWAWTMTAQSGNGVFGFALQLNPETNKFNSQAIFYSSDTRYSMKPIIKLTKHTALMDEIKDLELQLESATGVRYYATSLNKHLTVYKAVIAKIADIDPSVESETSTGKWRIIELARYKDKFAGVRGSDKVWGYATNGERYKIFWGRYLGKLSTKDEVDRGRITQVFYSKLDKGYTGQDFEHPAYNYIRSIVAEWK